MFFYLSDVASRPDSPPPLRPRWGKDSRQEGRKPRIMAQMRVPGNRPAAAEPAPQRPAMPGGRQNRPQALSASVVKLSPQPHSAVALGLLNVKVSLRPCLPKSITVPSTSARLLAST